MLLVIIALNVAAADAPAGGGDNPADALTIEALWAVRPSQGAPKNGRSVVREPTSGDGYDVLVSAHSRAPTAVSRDIAEAIRSTRE